MAMAAVVFAVLGCSTWGGAKARTTEGHLLAAGFQPRLADTPNRAAMMRALPPRQIVPVVVGGRAGYVYGNPDEAKFLVGNGRDYDKYLALVGQLPVEGSPVAPRNVWPVGEDWDWDEFAPLWW
ncbi:MAG: hypothetical protein WA771_14185 [Chthoniobacterales bacterium]